MVEPRLLGRSSRRRGRNDGSSCDTDRRLRQVRAACSARLVLLAVSNGERYLQAALESVPVKRLRTSSCWWSTTARRTGLRDPWRASVTRGFACSGTRIGKVSPRRSTGLEEARGATSPGWTPTTSPSRRLEQQLQRMVSASPIAVVGSAVMELDALGRVGQLHGCRSGRSPCAGLALFSSPFFHPSVLVDREVLETHGLRMTPHTSSEDYELWTRLLAHADGDNLPEPLLLYRVHAGQASQARRVCSATPAPRGAGGDESRGTRARS